jgi:hypothetical protein
LKSSKRNFFNLTATRTFNLTNGNLPPIVFGIVNIFHLTVLGQKLCATIKKKFEFLKYLVSANPGSAPVVDRKYS